jgi:hypothetical protein
MRTIMLLAMAASVTMADDSSKAARERKEGAPPARSHSRPAADLTTLTGVVDQVNGNWVISKEDSISPIAILRSSGFRDTNFGPYVGVRVEVRGRFTQQGSEKVFVVSKLSDIRKVEPADKSGTTPQGK